MKKLLYIDPFSEFGHLNLNRVFIRTLMDRGFNVRLAVREGYARDLGFTDGMVDLIIPEEYNGMGAGKMLARIRLWRIFRHIKRSLDLSAYEVVFFSAYEEISLYLSGIRRPLLLVDHANVSGLDNPFKRFFNRRLSRNAVHVVFAGFIRDRLRHWGFERVMVEPLGLPAPYEIDPAARGPVLRSIHAKLDSEAFDHIVFSPSGSKYGSPLMAEFVAHPGLLAYLEKNRILLVVKDRSLACAHPNVLILREVLSSAQYQALFMRSDLIMICYPASFNYRVSASLFESFSNGKPCLLTDIEGFRNFEPHFAYDPFFRDVDSALRVLEAWRCDKARIAAEPYRGLESQVPTFRDLDRTAAVPAGP